MRPALRAHRQLDHLALPVRELPRHQGAGVSARGSSRYRAAIRRHNQATRERKRRRKLRTLRKRLGKEKAAEVMAARQQELVHAGSNHTRGTGVVPRRHQ